MIDLPDKLPKESDKKIQDILNSDFTLLQKSYQIEGYYRSFIPYNRNPWRDQKQPELDSGQILTILEKR